MSDDFSTESTETVSMDDTIASAWADIQGSDEPVDNREPNGRFAAKEVAQEETQEELPVDENKVQDTPKVDQPVIEAKKSPVAWQKEIADKHWAKLDPELQDEILRREAAVDHGINKYRQSAQIGDAFTEIVKPYMPTMQQLGLDPGVAINELLKADNTLRYGSPEQKAHMALNIIRDYGIDVQALFGLVQNTPAQDPQVLELSRKVQSMEAQRQRDEQQREQAVMAQASTELAKFFEDKPHNMTTVGPLMAPFIEMGKSIQEAYDMAVYADPTLRAQALAQRDAEKQKEALQKVQTAKKAASVNVAPRGVLPSKPAGQGTLEATIEATARQMGMI